MGSSQYSRAAKISQMNQQTSIVNLTSIHQSSRDNLRTSEGVTRNSSASKVNQQAEKSFKDLRMDLRKKKCMKNYHAIKRSYVSSVKNSISGNAPMRFDFMSRSKERELF
mmetsp:Transcript_29796/g.45435  ORF Transcript_29796/g.45435 Transcript_29796/m.45435 type:complete len:110 (+) Transcript_29796:1499-1828(+)